MAAISNKPVGRILISNDDGVDSIGITILREIATALSVAAASKHQHRHVEGLDEFNGGRVALHRHVERTEPVADEPIGATLEADGARLEHIHDALEYRLEHEHEVIVRASLHQGDVDGVAPSLPLANLRQAPRPREEPLWSV